MKIILFLLGVLISLIGALPLLDKLNINISFLDFIPLSGVVYNVIIIVLGLLVIYFGVKGKKLKKVDNKGNMTTVIIKWLILLAFIIVIILIVKNYLGGILG